MSPTCGNTNLHRAEPDFVVRPVVFNPQECASICILHKNTGSSALKFISLDYIQVCFVSDNNIIQVTTEKIVIFSLNREIFFNFYQGKGSPNTECIIMKVLHEFFFQVKISTHILIFIRITLGYEL